MTSITHMTSHTCLMIFDPAVAIDDVHDPDEEVVNVDDEGGHDDTKRYGHAA